MGTEIERKFLVDPQWVPPGEGHLYRQGYISLAAERVVRVRIASRLGVLTIKGPNNGITRTEFEYKIPFEDASKMLNTMCIPPIIEKVRYFVPYVDHLWEVDVFQGYNQGLVIAEVELGSDTEEFARPDWALKDVSDDPRYYNSNLVKDPYRNWRERPALT